MKVDLTKNKDLYEAALAKYGPAPLSVGWRDETSQLLRFTKLAEVIENRKEPFTDNGFNVAHFTGHGISSKRVDTARELMKSDAVEFLVSDAVTKMADYFFNYCKSNISRRCPCSMTMSFTSGPSLSGSRRVCR